MACAALLGSLAAAMLHAETKNVQLLDLVRALKMVPNTQAIAAREGFTLHGLQIGPADANAQAGDQVSAGVLGIAAFSPRNLSKVVVVRALSSAPGGLVVTPGS